MPDAAKPTAPLLSVIMPIRNEAAILWHNAEILAAQFDAVVGAGTWKFILVDNNSTDSTPGIIKRMIERWPPSETVFVEKPNYGAALKAGFARADTPYVATLDVELWDLPFIAWAWKRRDDYDLFIGSRRADPSLCERPRYRWFLSWGLNAVLQLFFEFTGTETHGPKVIRMARMRELIERCVSDRGQYDTEIVLRAIRAGRMIVEVPISNSEVEGRKPRNLMLKKIVWNITAFNRLRRVLRDVPREGPVRYRRFTREDVLSEGEQP